MVKSRSKHKMSRFELAIDRSIPWMIIALVILLMFELFIDLTETQLFCMELINLFILIVFAVDLYYLFIQSSDWKHFVKYYWPDIIAVIPVAIVIKVMTLTGGGGFLPYATITGLFKLVRLERFLKGQMIKRVLQASQVSKVVRKLRLARSFRLVKAYDKTRLVSAETMTRVKGKKKRKKR